MGADGLAVHLSLKASGWAVQGDVVWVRRGAMLISITTLALPAGKAPNAEPIAQAALNRVHQAISVLPAT
jgi:hypothetical protein